MIEAQAIQDTIHAQYPHLGEKFSAVFSTILFDKVAQQLQWSVNDTELKRGLHRLHCFLQILTGENNAAHYSEFNEISHEKKQALLALLLIDSCKGSQEAAKAFIERGFTPVKDSVPFFFDTLKMAPGIYPIFNAISGEAKAYLTNNIFYLHQRHLQFGEVPLASLGEFNDLLGSKDANHMTLRLQLQNLFWIINLMGFDLPKLESNQRAEEIGPTMSPQRLVQLQTLQGYLSQCVTHGKTDPLKAYYLNQISPSISRLIDKDVNEITRVFIGRLAMLLCDKYSRSECDTTLSELLMMHSGTLIETANQEELCYKNLGLQAITFLPAVYWKLVELNKDEVPPYEIMLIFVKLQNELYTTLPDVRDSMQDNFSIPLFAMSRDEEFLRNFSVHPDYNLRLSLEIGQFITLSARLVAPTAQPYSTSGDDNKVIDPKQETHIPFASHQ